jgi:TRAP-type mannitol/chloroaromatic compound transport system permease large subunit
VAGKGGGPFGWPAIALVFVPLMRPIIAAMKSDMRWFATLIAVTL